MEVLQTNVQFGMCLCGQTTFTKLLYIPDAMVTIGIYYHM